jgi:hypothetical protein
MMDAASLQKENSEIWRRQCARHLMDCYALAMQGLMERPGDRELEALTRLMVDGMTAARGEEDSRAFYRMAADLCETCALGCGGRSGAIFRIYAALFRENEGGSV